MEKGKAKKDSMRPSPCVKRLNIVIQMIQTQINKAAFL